MKPRFSVIIPTVKQTKMVQDCVESFYRHEQCRGDCEIIIVDDGSKPEIQEWLKNWATSYPDVRVICKPANAGFAHTVNVGMREAKGDYLVLLNNDVTFTQTALTYIDRSFQSDPKIGVVGCKLLYPDGKVQHAGVVRHPGSHNFVHVHKNVPPSYAPVNRSKYFISVTGALFAIRRRAYNEIGGFNERYFLSCEDTEYCLRAWSAGWRVYYSHQAVAIHAEGGTRGNTDANKMKFGREWFIKERETWGKFAADVKRFPLEQIEKGVVDLNRGMAATPDIVDIEVNLARGKVDGIKLEIGSGYNPQPGYKHLDVRKDLPQIDYVCDFTKSALPFADGSVAEILTNHVIEHVSWRKDLPFVLKEWFRVLKPGGRLALRTPDLRFIAKTYLDNATTPEWPGDEQFIRDNFGEVSPAWWANIKLFAGQDYPSNFHFLCFDLEMLQGTLMRFGFESIRKTDLGPVFSPGELQIEAFKPDHNKAAPPQGRKKKILVKRKGALGDVLCSTPIVREIRLNNPDAIIDFATDSPAAYDHNPDIDARVNGSHPTALYDKVIDLDLVYERNPKMHIVDAYSAEVFGRQIEDKSLGLYPTVADGDSIERILRGNIGVANGTAVVIHAATTWENRTIPKKTWDAVTAQLLRNMITPIFVGSGADYRPGNIGIVDLIGKLTIHQIAALISHVGTFCGNDSGLIHVAGTTAADIIGIFTCAKAEYRIPYRNGVLGQGVKVLQTPLDCAGCLHDYPAPVVFAGCRRKDDQNACINTISAEQIVDAITAAIDIVEDRR